VDRSVAKFDAPTLGSSVAADVPDDALVVPNPYRVDIAETNLRQTDVPFETYQVLPVLLLLIISVGVLGGSLLGSRDHERRTNIFLRSTPLRRSSFVLGRLLGTLLATLTILVPVLVYLTWNGTIDPPSGHWPAFLAVLAETAVLSAGLGVMLGVIFTRSTTVALVAIIAASYLFFLGGGFTTIAFLPEWLRIVSRAVPTRYAIDGMRQALFYRSLDGVGMNLVILGGFAVSSVVAGVLALERQATTAR
jgi:ABC-2 type transport system permease protein